MAVLRVCDFCKETLPKSYHVIHIDSSEPIDVCEDCFTGCVILNERSRLKSYRRRRPGRPKGSKTVKQSDNLPMPLGAVSEGE